MASPSEVEVTVTSAKDLKNVNWRNGPIRPYAVVWVDPNNKSSTRVDEEGDTFALWEQTLTLPIPPGSRIEDQTLSIDVVHARSGDEDTKPLIGSARLKLTDVLDDVGFGERVKKSLQLKRPSGRPHGKIDVKVMVRESRYQSRDAYYAPPYGVPPPSQQSSSRDYNYSGGYGTPYGAPPQSAYYSTGQPPAVYPYSASPVQPGHEYGGQYGQQPGYGGYGGQYAPPVEEKKKSKFGGMGTGLAVGAVAGAVGGLALAEGFDALEDKIADDAAEKVEDDLGYDDDGGEDY